jgi:hypothetical protein
MGVSHRHPVSEPPTYDTDNLPEAMIKPIASGLLSNDLHPLDRPTL